MPIYEYQCKECGVRFERIQSFSDEPVRVCPECEGEVQRLIQPAGIIFKGSGFYVNDSKSSRQNLNSTPRKETASEPAASNKKSDDSSSTSSTDD
jgi:putative FmdB family regulatory protein